MTVADDHANAEAVDRYAVRFPRRHRARDRTRAVEGRDEIAYPNFLNCSVRAVRHQDGSADDRTELKLGSLVPKSVGVRVEIRERQRRATREREALVLLVPGDALRYEPRFRPVHDGARQREVRVRAAEDQRRVSRHVDVLQRRHQQRAGLASARRAAVQRFEGRAVQELLLPLRRPLRRVLDAPAPPPIQLLSEAGELGAEGGCHLLSRLAFAHIAANGE